MRPEKQFLIDEVAAHLAKSKYLLLADFTRVTVQDAATVRALLREHGAEYHVVKNTIFNIAAKQSGLPDLGAHLAGHTALVTGGNNPPGVAKVIVKFFEDKARLEVKVGVLDDKILSKAEIEELSKLPSLDGIRAQILALISTPASQIVRLLVAKKEKDEAAAGEATAA
ncbi:MAG: 50S ribosomal protein L10 [Puniceicoccales bacterium]|jgi:large subunit ribosomal protein L10|nr:50S ribosomal protein L10 [Puniceicoccales bacterium]